MRRSRIVWPLVSAAVFFMFVGSVSSQPAVSSESDVYLSGQGASEASAADRMRAAARARGTIRVIVGLDSPIGSPAVVGAQQARAQRAAFQEAAAGFAARVFGAVPARARFKPFDVIPFAVLTVSPGELERVLSDRAVQSVQEDAHVTVTPRLNETIKLTSANYLWPAGRANRGRGRTIAIIDAGFDPTLPALKGRIVHQVCHASRTGSDACVTNYRASQRTKKSTGAWASWGCKQSPKHYADQAKKQQKPVYCENHGTMVSATVAASSVNVRKFGRFNNGIAPAAGVVLSRVPIVANSRASIAEGIEDLFKKRKRFKIEAVTMSLGLDRSGTECSGRIPVIEHAINALVDAGIPFFNSAGNDGSDFEIDYPGCLEKVVSVGASQENDKRIVKFSDTNHLVDLLAPGEDVLVVAGKRRTAWHTAGSSFSAPTAAAGYALLKAANRNKSADEILTAMRCTGKYLAKQGQSWGVPRIDLKQAHQFLRNPAYKLGWEFNSKDDALGWESFFDEWTVSGGNLVLSESDEINHDLILHDLCFRNFEITARMQYAYKMKDDAVAKNPRGILLLKEDRHDDDLPDDLKLNGFMITFADDDYADPDNAWIYELEDIPSDNFVFGKRLLCKGGKEIQLYRYADMRVVVRNDRISFYLNGDLMCSAQADTSGLRSVALYAYLPNPDLYPTRYVGPRFFKTDYLRIKGLK